MTDETAPRRLRSVEVIDNQQAALMAALTRRSGSESTVELTRNAKGDVQVAVKVSNENPLLASEDARAIFDGLCEAYPRDGGDV